MAKVIVERPRWGSRLPSKKKGSRRIWQGTPLEDRPRREPMPGAWRGLQRHLNEHLGPMRRFLRSNIGRPWNCVHQELCEHVSFDNAVQAHVLAHIYDYVSLHVEVQDGHIVRSLGSWRGHQFQPGEMYVCPETGLLRQVRSTKPKQSVGRVQQGPMLVYLHRDGAWWEVRLRTIPANLEEVWDIWFERDVANVSRGERRAAFGGDLIAVSKRPLGRQEVVSLQRELREAAKR